MSLEYLFRDQKYLEALKGDPFINSVPGGGVRGAASLAEETLRSAKSAPEEIELAKQAIRVRDYYGKVLEAAAEYRQEVSSNYPNRGSDS